MGNLILSKIKLIILPIGLALCIGAGIWVGYLAYFVQNDYPRFANDWKLMVFYGGLLLVGVALILARREKLLLTATIILWFSFASVTLLRMSLIKEALAFIFLIITAASLGDTLYRFIFKGTGHSNVERFVISFPIGFSGLMILGLILGLSGGLTTEIAYSSITIILLLTVPTWLKFVWEILKNVKRTWKIVSQHPDTGIIAAVVFFFAVFLIGPYLWASAPAIRWDSLSYHVAVPQIYISHQAMVEIPESVQTYWAHYAEILYTLGMLLGGQPLPGWLHLFMGILSAGFTAIIGARLINWKIGAIAALIFFTIPLVNYELSTAYIEGFTTLFVLAMLFSALNWYRFGYDRWLFLSGLFAGFSLGVKLNSLPFVLVCFSMAIVYRSWKERSWAGLVKTFVSLIFPALVFWSPWLIRDWLWTGNPIFPNYNSLFQSSKWSQSDFFAIKPNLITHFADSLRIPWDMVINSKKFYHEAPGGAMLSLPWLAMPWFLLKPQDCRRTRYLSLTFFFILFSSIILFSITKLIRYMIPIFPLFGILAAVNLEIGWGLLRKHLNQTICLFTAAILAVFYLFSSQLSVIIRMPSLAERYPVQYAFGWETSNEFLEKTLPFLGAFQTLNEAPGKPKVLSLGIEFRLYTDARIYGGYFSNEVKQILNGPVTGEALADAMRVNGFDYLLIYTPDYYFRPEVYYSPALTRDFFDKYTKLEFSKNRTYLYNLVFDPGQQRSSGPNLLEGSNFEADLELRSTWYTAGDPSLDQSGTLSYSGIGAALFPGSTQAGDYSTLMQVVPINDEGFYTSSVWGKAKGENISLQLMLNWIDAEGKSIQIDFDWVPMSENWNYYWLSAHSPPNAAKVEVSYAVFGDGAGYVDDVSFNANQAAR